MSEMIFNIMVCSINKNIHTVTYISMDLISFGMSHEIISISFSFSFSITNNKSDNWSIPRWHCAIFVEWFIQCLAFNITISPDDFAHIALKLSVHTFDSISTRKKCAKYNKRDQYTHSHTQIDFSTMCEWMDVLHDFRRFSRHSHACFGESKITFKCENELRGWWWCEIEQI